MLDKKQQEKVLQYYTAMIEILDKKELSTSEAKLVEKARAMITPKEKEDQY